MGKPITATVYIDSDGEIKAGAKVNIGGFTHDTYNGVITKLTKKKIYVKWNDGSISNIDRQCEDCR